MGPCWPGGWFLPAAHISGQIFVRNKKFSIVVVHHESYRKNIPISFKVLIVWLTSAFFEQKLKLCILFLKSQNSWLKQDFLERNSFYVVELHFSSETKCRGAMRCQNVLKIYFSILIRHFEFWRHQKKS